MGVRDRNTNIVILVQKQRFWSVLEHPIFQNVENYGATIRPAIKSNPGAKYISVVSKKRHDLWKIDLRPLGGGLEPEHKYIVVLVQKQRFWSVLEHPIFQNVENYSATIRPAIKSNPSAKYISMVSKKWLNFCKIDLRPLSGGSEPEHKKIRFYTNI